MGPKQAMSLGLREEDAPWYIQLFNAKANLAPPAGSALWFHRVSVKLPNGDSVGAVEKAQLIDGRIEAAAESMEQKDIVSVLAKYIEPGNLVPVSMASQWLRESGLFTGDLMPLLERGIHWGCDLFVYKDGGERREKHWVMRVA